MRAINTVMPKQSGAILQTTYSNASSRMTGLVLWFNFVLQGSNNNKPVLVQFADKQLPETMLA